MATAKTFPGIYILSHNRTRYKLRVDPEDFERCKAQKWHVTWVEDVRAYVPYIWGEGQKMISGAQFVLDTPPGVRAYWKTYNRMDCRRVNLVSRLQVPEGQLRKMRKVGKRKQPGKKYRESFAGKMQELLREIEAELKGAVTEREILKVKPVRFHNGLAIKQPQQEDFFSLHNDPFERYRIGPGDKNGQR